MDGVFAWSLLGLLRLGSCSLLSVFNNSVRAPAALIDCKVVINSQHGMVFVKQKGGYRTASHLENPSSFYPPLSSLAKKPEPRLLLQSFRGLHGSFLLMPEVARARAQRMS
eukprot:scaffold5864_cov93-Skeletonema_dohrnii-CCMP3373.AAC.12